MEVVITSLTGMVAAVVSVSIFIARTMKKNAEGEREKFRHEEVSKVKSNLKNYITSPTRRSI